MRPTCAVGGAVLAVLAAACTTTRASGGPVPALVANPSHARLVAAAGLDACPASSGGRVGALPDVSLPCLGKGPAVHLAGLHGRPLLVNVWGSWCAPCQQESAYLSRAYDALRGRVEFLGVDDEDDPNSALDFAAHVRPPMRFPSVVDTDKAVLLAMHQIAVPMTLFVTASGRVVHRHLGPYRSVLELRADITRYLGVAS